METKKDNRAKGINGEEEAASFLVKHGYKILQRNWTSGKLELDIIATKGKYIVFVEVKTRYSKAYIEPWEAVNRKKQQNIIRAAHHYIRKMDVNAEPRFDILSIFCVGSSVEIDHFEGAFWPIA